MRLASYELNSTRFKIPKTMRKCKDRLDSSLNMLVAIRLRHCLIPTKALFFVPRSIFDVTNLDDVQYSAT